MQYEENKALFSRAPDAAQRAAFAERALQSRGRNEHRCLWVPAFAGTTTGPCFLHITSQLMYLDNAPVTLPMQNARVNSGESRCRSIRT